jgi:hypothetical protein
MVSIGSVSIGATSPAATCSGLISVTGSSATAATPAIEIASAAASASGSESAIAGATSTTTASSTSCRSGRTSAGRLAGLASLLQLGADLDQQSVEPALHVGHSRFQQPKLAGQRLELRLWDAIVPQYRGRHFPLP